MKVITILGLLLFSVFSKAEVEQDKLLHFGVSYGIAKGLNTYVIDDYRVAYLACIGVGALKETYDYYDYGEFGKKDMMANALGCGVGMWVSEVFQADYLSINANEENFMVNFDFAF